MGQSRKPLYRYEIPDDQLGKRNEGARGTTARCPFCALIFIQRPSMAEHLHRKHRLTEDDAHALTNGIYEGKRFELRVIEI